MAIIVNSYPLLLDDCELLDVLPIQHHCVPEVGHTMVQRVVEEVSGALGHLTDLRLVLILLGPLLLLPCPCICGGRGSVRRLGCRGPVIFRCQGRFLSLALGQPRWTRQYQMVVQF